LFLIRGKNDSINRCFHSLLTIVQHLFSFVEHLLNTCSASVQFCYNKKRHLLNYVQANKKGGFISETALEKLKKETFYSPPT